MKKIIGVMAVAMLLIGALIAPATADVEDPEVGNTCKDTPPFSTNLEASTSGAWGSIDFSDTEKKLTLTVNEGWEVELCVKAGSKQQGDGPENAGTFGEGTHEIGHNSGKELSHYAYIATELPPPPPTQTVSFTKAWEGDAFDDSDVVVTFDVNIDGTVGTYDDGEVIDYADSYQLVGENVSGFPDNGCSWEQTGQTAASGTDDQGNSSAAYTIINTVECDEEEEPETQTISFTKIWEGDDFEGSDEVEVTFDVLIDGEEVTLADGEESAEFAADAEWSFVGENVTGFPDDVCEYEAEVSEEDGTVTNTVECAEVQETPPLEQPPGEEEPTVETVKVEKKVETEVLAATATLPKTGVPALVLALLGLLAVGSGGAILRRR